MSYWQIRFRWTQQHPRHDVALTDFLGTLRCNASLVRAANAWVFNIHNNWLFLHCLSELAIQKVRVFSPITEVVHTPPNQILLDLNLVKKPPTEQSLWNRFHNSEEIHCKWNAEKATEAANWRLDKNTRLWQMSETQIGLKLCKWSSSTTCENKSFERNILRSIFHPAIT